MIGSIDDYKSVAYQSVKKSFFCRYVFEEKLFLSEKLRYIRCKVKVSEFFFSDLQLPFYFFFLFKIKRIQLESEPRTERSPPIIVLCFSIKLPHFPPPPFCNFFFLQLYRSITNGEVPRCHFSTTSCFTFVLV